MWFPWRKSKKPSGRVKVTVMAFLDGKATNKQFEWEIAEGMTLNDLFKELDRKGPFDRGYFKRIFSLSRPPTLLHNGNRIHDISELKEIKLSDGDEVSVLMPIAGGS